MSLLLHLMTPGPDTDERFSTWAGQSFDTEDGKPTGQVAEESLNNGVLEIEASSAALICFK